MTKDGRIVGNAIIAASATTDHGIINVVETDFGNVVRLSDHEINEWYHVVDVDGNERVGDVVQWRADRIGLQNPIL